MRTALSPIPALFRLLSLGLLALLLASAAPAAPQGAQGERATQEEPAAQVEPAGAPEPGAAQVPTQHKSPRDVIRAFLDAKRDGDLDRLGAFFDLTDVPALNTQIVVERRSDYLLIILERIPGFKLSDLPDSADPDLAAGNYGFTSWLLIPGQLMPVPVGLGFVRGADGRWRIDAATGQVLETLATSIEHLPRASDLTRGARTWREAFRDWRARNLPSVLTAHAFLLANWQWLGLLILVFAALVTDRAVRFVTRLLAQKLIGKVQLDLDQDLRNFVRPVGIWISALIFRLCLGLLDLAPEFHTVIDIAAAVIVSVGGVWSVYRLVDVFSGVLEDRARRSENKFDDVLVPLMRRTLKILVLIVGLFYIASWWADSLWQLMAGISVGSIALTFAAKDSIENLFGTFTVLLDKPFALGDWIRMGDVDGNVEHVGFRSTRVRTFYNSLISIPNSKFIASNVDNMGARRYRRIKATLGLTYDTPPEKIEAFCEALRELIRGHPYTRKDYYHVYFNGFGDSGLQVLLYTFVETPDWASELREKHRLYTDILRVAERLEVSFAFPSRSIYMVEEKDLAHPDRPGGIEAGLERGRAVAEEVLEESLEGLPLSGPPPPAFDGPDPDFRL